MQNIENVHTMHTVNDKNKIITKVSIGRSGNPRAPFEVRWRENGKVCRRRFKNKVDALRFASDAKAEYAMPAELRFDLAERVIFAQVKIMLDKAGMPIDKLPDIVRDKLAERLCAGCEWSKAVAEFINDCHRRNLRLITVNGYARGLRSFYNAEMLQNVAQYGQEAAEKYLTSVLSPLHQKRLLSAFFAFCKKKKWVVANPFDGAHIAGVLRDKATPQIITPEQCRDMFATCPVAWKPALALMAFAGVRPTEVLPDGGKREVVRVGDIDFKRRVITIRAEVAKTRVERRLAGLPDILWRYLAPLKGTDKRANIAAGSYTVFRRVKDGLDVRLSKDALRHSFASYGFHFLGAEHTVEILGHVGGFGVFAKHYKGLADADSAAEYFNI